MWAETEFSFALLRWLVPTTDGLTSEACLYKAFNYEYPGALQFDPTRFWFLEDVKLLLLSTW